MAPFPILTTSLRQTSGGQSHQIHAHLYSRDIANVATAPQLIPLVILAAILSTSIFLITAYILRRIWYYFIHPRIEFYRGKPNIKSDSTPPGISTATKTINTTTKDNWARKDSNVLWSSYIDEADLMAQFNSFARRPSALGKASRLFSIGSVSTVDMDQSRCPLDTTPAKLHRPRSASCAPVTGITTQDNEKKDDKEHIEVSISRSEVDRDDTKLRSRSIYEHETTPTKSLPGPNTFVSDIYRTYRAASTPNGHRCSHSFDAATGETQA